MSARNEDGAAAHRVVILGAGYAGLSAAIQLASRVRRRDDVRVTLVNERERFTERLRLHMAATGQRLAELSIPDLLEGTGAHFERGRVTELDADAKTVRIDGTRVLTYDTLVYALGGVADTTAVPGAGEHAYALDGARDAEALADRLSRLGGGTVVVAGTGLTGVESAAEIAERHPELNVVLLGRTEPGAAMNPKAKAYLHAALERLGVTVRSGAEVVKVLPGSVELACSVELAGGGSVAADVVLWASGTRMPPLPADAGLTVDARGRIVTDAALRSVSHPDVYAVGDAAMAMGPGNKPLRMSCASGIPAAWLAADAIAARLTGGKLPDTRIRYFNQCVSLGRKEGLIQYVTADDRAVGAALTGRLAAVYKELVCRGAAWGVAHPTLGLPVRRRPVTLRRGQSPLAGRTA